MRENKYLRYWPSLEQKAVELTGESSLPVDLRGIVYSMGILVQYGDTSGAPATLVSDQVGRYKIVLSNEWRHYKDRRAICRFLVAHELAHKLLHDQGSDWPVGTKEYWDTEDICNWFAQRLLLPDWCLMEAQPLRCMKVAEVLHRTFVLARNAQVSWQTVAYRVSGCEKSIQFIELRRLGSFQGGPYEVKLTTMKQRREIGRRVERDSALALAIATIRRGRVEDLPVEAIRAAFPSMVSAVEAAVQKYHLRICVRLANGDKEEMVMRTQKGTSVG